MFLARLVFAPAATGYRPVLKYTLILRTNVAGQRSYQLPSIFQNILVFGAIDRTSATSYHPFQKVHQPPATDQFLKLTLNLKKKTLPGQSYQLPSDFETILFFWLIAKTAATSYQPFLKYTLSFVKKIFQGKSYQLPSVFQSILQLWSIACGKCLWSLQRHLLPATLTF